MSTPTIGEIVTVTHVVLVAFENPADERIDDLRAAVRGLAETIPMQSLVEGESNSPKTGPLGCVHGFRAAAVRKTLRGEATAIS